MADEPENNLPYLREIQHLMDDWLEDRQLFLENNNLGQSYQDSMMFYELHKYVASGMVVGKDSYGINKSDELTIAEITGDGKVLMLSNGRYFFLGNTPDKDIDRGFIELRWYPAKMLGDWDVVLLCDWGVNSGEPYFVYGEQV